jgi:hypothetical protein
MEFSWYMRGEASAVFATPVFYRFADGRQAQLVLNVKKDSMIAI